MDYKYSSKKKYEEELWRIILARNSQKEDTSDLEELYEDLVEEYLHFCTNNKDG